jgi:hypothetical protein
MDARAVIKKVNGTCEGWYYRSLDTNDENAQLPPDGINVPLRYNEYVSIVHEGEKIPELGFSLDFNIDGRIRTFPSGGIHPNLVFKKIKEEDNQQQWMLKNLSTAEAEKVFKLKVHLKILST